MFKVGEWVAHRRGGIQGYVVSSGAERTMVEYEAKDMWRKITIDNVNLYKMGDFLTPDELYELIDIALAVDDHKWFMQLWEKCEKARERH